MSYKSAFKNKNILKKCKPLWRWWWLCHSAVDRLWLSKICPVKI